MPKISLPKKLAPLIKKRKRYKILLGGRGSGKSQSVAQICIVDAQTKGIKTGCFREFQNSIDDSVFSLLSTVIRDSGAQGFEIQASRIMYNGEDAFKFKGLARNPDAVKSMHGFKRFWVEEAQTISARSLELLRPTLREEGSEIWMTANPGSRADPFSQEFIVPYEKALLEHGYYEDDDVLIVVMNYCDNPFFPDVLEQERQRDLATKSTALYNHTWLGHFYDEVADTIIPVDWFDAAIDSHKKLNIKPTGAIICAFDPSDEGGDAKGLAVRHGSVFLAVKERTVGDINDGCDWAIDEALKHGADHFIWDCDGLGIGLKRQIDEALAGKKIDYHLFKGSEGVEDPEADYIEVDSLDNAKRKTNRDTFKNKRAQYYWKLRDRFYKTYRAVTRGEYIDPDELISLDSSIESLNYLRAEVCRIPLKRNNNGKIQIMSKLEMAKMNLPSPNMADSLMMCMFAPTAATKPITINFSGWGG